MNVKSVLGLLALLGIALAGLPSVTFASPEDATACAQQMADVAFSQSFRLRMSDSDSLVQGYYMNYKVTLLRGNEYVILACGDSRAVDLDIYLFDESGNLIDRDRLTDNKPMVTVTPRWTGTFYVEVYMYESRGAANYTMALLYR